METYKAGWLIIAVTVVDFNLTMGYAFPGIVTYSGIVARVTD